MNWNITAYVCYLTITGGIIYKVGKICYYNGIIMVQQLLPHHVEWCVRINQILLVAYYLVNMGYGATCLIHWDHIQTAQQLVETIAQKTALIMGIIAFLHYMNIYIIIKYIQKLI